MASPRTEAPTIERVGESQPPVVGVAAGGRSLSARVLFLALILIPLNCYWIMQMERVRQGPYVTSISLFANVVFLLLLFLIGNSALGLMVNPQLPVNSLKELIAFAKAHPGKINFGSAGQGATSHLAGEYLKMLSGIDIVHVPFKGAAPALTATVAGQIEMLISGLSSGMPYVKQKQLKLLAVSSAKRASLVPDVPTMAETLPGYDVGSWYAVLAPAGTPRAVIDKLNQASIATVTTPEVQSRLVALGIDVEPMTPEQLAAKLTSEYERWGKVVKAAGMTRN